MSTITAYEVWTGDGPLSSVVGIHNSSGQVRVSDDPESLLSFLRYTSKGTIRVFWDIDQAIAPILRLLPVPILQQLSQHASTASFAGHHLFYLSDCIFWAGNTRYYSLKQFWPVDTEVPQNLEELQSRADELVETLSSCGMADFTVLTTPIAVFERTELGRRVYAAIPKSHDINPSCHEAVEYASWCDKREWISAYQIGHWREGEIWDFDLSSSYPSTASGLFHLDDMEFWKSRHMGRNEESACYGLLCGRLRLSPDAPNIHCSPFMTNLGNMPGNPAGDFGSHYFFTLDEYRLLTRCGWGEFDLTSGWFMHPRSGVRPRLPFKDIMDYLYEQRQYSDQAATVMKGVANQLVGKLIETRVNGGPGKIRNDIYHSIILSQARVRVAEFLLNNEVTASELVAVQTDGVRLTREIPLPRTGFGKWRCNGSRPTIVTSPYKVYVDDKRPGHLTYDHITSMIAEHPLSSYYGRTVAHRTTLRQALQQGDISKVGLLDDLPAHLDLNSIPREQNRVFSKFPKTGAALLSGKYTSSPVILH